MTTSDLDPALYGEDYFTRTYRDYERQNPVKKLAFYQSVLERHARTRIPASLLDIGCGLGSFLGHMRLQDPVGRRWQLTGTDISGFAIARNQARHPGVAFEEMPASRLAEIGKTFDAITAFDVLEHLPALTSTLNVIDKCLGKCGTVVAVVPVYDGPLGPLVRLVDRDPTHVHKQARSWWLQRLAEQFTIADWWGIFTGLAPWGYLHRPSKRWRSISPAIMIIAQKK